MTGNEAELIERLIVEAAKRGAVELERERAVKAAEEAASAMLSERLQLSLARTMNESVMRQVDALRVELHESRNREQAYLIALGEASDAIGRFAKAGRNKQKPYDALLAAKDKADKLQDPIPF
jgi:hypothetical protein